MFSLPLVCSLAALRKNYLDQFSQNSVERWHMGHRRDHLHSGVKQGHVTLGRIKEGLRLWLGGEQVTVTFCGILFIYFILFIYT